MVLSAGIPQRANANLLVNAGFETGGFTVDCHVCRRRNLVHLLRAAFPLCTSPVPANSGQFAAVFGGSNGISRTVTLILGHTYLLSYACNNSFSEARDTFWVSLNGTFVDSASGRNLQADQVKTVPVAWDKSMRAAPRCTGTHWTM